jgi:hypothetical protein
MNNNPIFNISVNGNYPNETYSITPKTEASDPGFIATNPFPNYPNFNGFWTNLGTNISRNYINYNRNYLVPVIDIFDRNYSNYVYYTNTTYLTASDVFPIDITTVTTDPNFVRYIERQNVISFQNNSIIHFDIASLRQYYKTPYEFNFFYFKTNPTTNYPLGLSYGYILYPNKIFLNPTNLSYNNNTNKWTLTTNVKILSSTFLSVSQSNLIESDILSLHKKRLKSLPNNLLNLPINLNTNNFVFDIRACRTHVNYPAFAFGNTTVPSSSTILLDSNNDILYINPDTTFVTFSATFLGVYLNSNNSVVASNDPTRLKLLQKQPSSNYLINYQTFNPTFIPTYDPSTGNQTFKLIQEALNPKTLSDPPILPMSDSSNCVLSATITPTGNFSLYNPYAPVDVKLENGGFVGVNYIADCKNLSTLGILASSTLTSFTINGSPALLKTNITGSTIGTNDIVWETSYPPHCYTYKINLLDSTGVNYLDSNPLNFYVKLTAQSTFNTAMLSAYIGSDFNAIKYSLDSSDEKISYQILDTSLSSIDAFLSNVKCTYGNGSDYKLTNANDTTSQPQIVQASQGKDLKIIYNGADFAGVTFVIKASLKTAAGYLDQYEPLNVTMGLPSSLNGNNITIQTLREESNFILIDSSFNVNASSWPSRDLTRYTPSSPVTGTKITWDWYNTSTGLKDLPVSFNYVDSDGNYIAPINGQTIFNSDTWKVALSGYGPNKVTVSLYSEKYNETATKDTNPLLYNFLQPGKFVVTPISDLNNLNLTRTIKLKVQVPYGNNLFDIPNSIPINWTWEYDNFKNADLLPITANQILNNNAVYPYNSNGKSSTLSAIQINVTPGYSKTIPTIHKVKVIAQTNIVTPPVSGSYTFYVDDFPDPSIFNADFATYYSVFTTSSAYQIANTRYKNNTVTRPNGYDLNCTFIANNDVLTHITKGNINWVFNGSNTLNNTNTYTLDLNNPNLNLPNLVSYNYPVTSAQIGLNLNSAIAPGWTSAHNTSAVTNFYILSSTDFYQPLKFIVYPEYAWLSPDKTYATLLSTNPASLSYYTNSYRPSAYGNKKSNSQTFWLSANKQCFSEHIYQNLDTYDIFQTVSAYDLLDITYNPYDLAASIGIPISLNGYNNTFYPENLQDSYLIYKNFNGIQTLVTEYYTIFTKTIDLTEPTNNLADNFFLSPIILPYNNLSLNFTVNQTDINLDINKNISITQNINTFPANQPAKVIGGTVTYYLSSHFWTVSSTVPAVNGTYSLFNLQIGDPAIPLNSGDLGKDYFYIYAKTNVLQQIPASTFDNYSKTEYPKDRDLWDTIKV